ncbi:ATP-dependent DNA helicase [Trichonephila clavipes]|nr:ATP-dependent DNA helicase [Trichonephila clavipes]
MYSVEWQKRGLPHAHILVWFIDKIRPEEIDSIISAEIPDPSTDQLLFDIVTTNMIHGPCGTLNSSSPCMADGKCTKNFPKDMNNDVTNVDGYPIYRRRNPENGGQSFIKNINNTDIDIDNRWVVPYSPLLSKTYNAHINVEFCSSVKSIKYICKYVHKGSDMAVFRVENTNVNAPPVNKNDEITLYQIGRYISSNEAAWRIFGFPIHERDPAVVQLAIHLENGQRVFFTNETAIDRAINPPKTTLTAFLNCVIVRMILVLLHEHYSIHKYHAISHGLKQKHGCPASKAHQLLHVSIYLNQTPWGDYLQSVQDTLSAFIFDCCWLMLLAHYHFKIYVKVNGQQYPTYKDACLALGLLEDDNQWECMLAEVALNCTAIQIRRLFAIVLTTCFPARAQILWEIHKDSMTDDILHQHRIRCHDPTITFSDEMYNEALIAIEDLCIVIANYHLVISV